MTWIPKQPLKASALSFSLWQFPFNNLSINPDDSKGESDRNFGGFAAVKSVFPADGPYRAVSAVFRAPGGRNGAFTSCTSPRRSDAPADPSAPRLPFFHIIVGSLQQKRDSGPFRGSPGRSAFWETAEIGRRPLGETTLRGRFCKNPENSNGWNERNFGGFEPVYPVFHVGGPKRALFWAPGGPGPIRKRQFSRHAKTAAENGSNPVRLLKCHVRREKGPTRGPEGPSVTGRGAHVSPRG